MVYHQGRSSFLSCHRECLLSASLCSLGLCRSSNTQLTCPAEIFLFKPVVLFSSEYVLETLGMLLNYMES